MIITWPHVVAVGIIAVAFVFYTALLVRGRR